MKPFDLMAAIKGDKVVTKEGIEVELEKFFIKNGQLSGRIKTLIGEGFWDLNGKIISYDNKYDLFMATKKKKLWIAIHAKPDNSGDYKISHYAYARKERLVENDYLMNDPYKIIEIEIDEE